MSVWLLMLLLAVLFHTGDIVSTFALFYYGRKYHWHVEELNKMFAWWVEKDGWVGSIGFVAALEVKITVVVVAYLLILYISEYFGIILALWMGCAFIAMFMNIHNLGNHLKWEENRRKDIKELNEGVLLETSRLGLVDKPRTDEPPVFIGETISCPNRYLWWYHCKGGRL